MASRRKHPTPKWKPLLQVLRRPARQARSRRILLKRTRNPQARRALMRNLTRRANRVREAKKRPSPRALAARAATQGYRKIFRKGGVVQCEPGSLASPQMAD